MKPAIALVVWEGNLCPKEANAGSLLPPTTDGGTVSPPTNGRRRHSRVNSERDQERFSTEGASFLESLRRVIAGGADNHDQVHKADDQREADK